MNPTIRTIADSPDARSALELDRKLNAASGGLILIWLGIALLLHAGWSLGLVGVGALLVGEQVARRYHEVKFEQSWLVAGFVILGGGIVARMGLGFWIVPALLIAIGVALLGSAMSRRQERV